MSRIEEVKQYWAEIIDSLYKEKEKFTDFMSFSGRIFKYSFEDSALIYAQKPDTTMIADLPVWNRAGRRVNKGAKSIAVFGENDKCRYLFDVLDTNGEKIPFQWKLDEKTADDVIKSVNNNYDLKINSPVDCISFLMDSTASVHLFELEDFAEKLNLTDEQYESLEKSYLSCAKHIVSSRCEYNSDLKVSQSIDLQAFSLLKNTDNFIEFNQLIFSTAKETLLSIEKELKNIYIQRRKNYERANLQGRRIRDVEPSDGVYGRFSGERTPETADRTLRTGLDEVDETGIQPQGITSDSEMSLADNPTIDRQGSRGNEGSSERTILSGTSAQTDGISSIAGLGERTSDVDREQNNDGNSLSAEKLITEEKAVSKDAAFVMTPEILQACFEGACNSSSGFSAGKTRIYRAFKEDLTTVEEKAKFLKQEYGIGGCSWDYKPYPISGMLNHNSKGLTLEMSLKGDFCDTKYDYSWKQVANQIDKLIQSGKYLTPVLHSYSVGDTVIDEDKILKIHSIDEETKEVHLFDITENENYFKSVYKSMEEIEQLYSPVPNVEITKEPLNAKVVANEYVPQQISFDSLGNAVNQQVEIIPEIKAAEKSEINNYRFSSGNIIVGGQKTRYKANIEAIKTLKLIENENRYATSEEQTVMARYVGWGGIPQAFDKNNTEWEKEYTELKNLLSEDEYSAACESTLTSFYTSPDIIRAVYTALDNFGFKGGNILEPSMGVGNFFSLLPEKMQKSKLYGVELDSISGRIAQQLYPNADIQIKGFEKINFNDNSFDVVIGNVPFGNFKVSDSKYDKYNFHIHDYFFAKAIDKVKPNGIVAFITSKGTLDKKDNKFRKYLAERCDLIGAVRLPNTAFKGSAGTDVTSDIIFLQKREKMTIEIPDWINLSQTDDGIPINSYFLEHSEMMLGKMIYDTRMFGENSSYTTLVPFDDGNFVSDLNNAVSKLSARINTITKTEKQIAHTIPADPNVRNYTHTIVGNDLYFRENEIMTKINASGKALERMKGLNGLRTITLELINSQAENCTDEQLKVLQNQLNSAYDGFVKENGYVSNTANARCFDNDDDYNTLCALEVVDSEKKTIIKAQIFTQRTVKPTIEITEVDTSAEAMQVSLDVKGCIDIPYMAKLCKTEPIALTNELLEQERIFINPIKYNPDEPFAGYEENSEYLSGNVREKLRTAKSFNEQYPDIFIKNISALENVLPKKLEAPEISVRISAAWIDVEDYSRFLYEYARANMISYPLRRAINGEYKIQGKNQDKSITAISTYGTKRMSSYAIFENLLNQRDNVIRDTITDENGNKIIKVNNKYTQLAAEKARQMKEAFPKWLWQDINRREKYVERYNNYFNAIRGREYDGEHQTFPGMSPSINLRPHQKSAIARAKYNGNTLLAHCVGAGKSFEMIASVMEKKRLGLINKACVVVPKHLTLQTASEWARLYPTAKLLVAAPKDFEKNGRQKFIARCVTGDYDGIIMSFTQFEKITMSDEYRKQFLEKEREDIINALEEMDSTDRLSVKDLERQKKNIDTRLDKLLKLSGKDTSLQFEQLGFDYLVVDEAHYYKNCLVVSRMKNVAGVSTTAAQKSEDMLMKCKWLNEKTDYKGILFATGTPVSNSMVELYTMKRYLRPDLLEKSGLSTFDDWAATFGEVVSQLEIKPAGDGFRTKKRFSKFVNIPELMSMYKEFADIQTADMVKLPVPSLKNGKPQIIVAQPNDFQKAYMKILAQRSEAIHNGAVDPRVDNMLKITHEARLLGLDARCINPNAENSPDSKVNKCIDNVMMIYEKTNADKGVQVIFCDIAINDDDGKYSIYEYIREELHNRGIPENEICCAGDVTTDEKRAEMFSQLRSGEKRVIIASTSKLGTGANIQDRLAGLHHLDIPWRPADLEQRNGRIIRQGNMFSEVEVLHYTTAETFDTYMLNIITTKQKFISQVMTSKSPARVCEDVDEMVLTYSEMQAVTSGNPLIKEKIELDNDISRLRLLESEHNKEIYALQELSEKKLPQEISSYTEIISKAKKDFEVYKVNQKENFSIVINDRLYTERKDAGAALRNDITQCLVTNESKKLGEYAGFSLSIEKQLMKGCCSAVIKGELKYYSDIELDNDVGNIIRIENLTKNGIQAKIDRFSEELSKAKTDLNEAKSNTNKPFEHANELKQKLERIAAVNNSLSLNNTEEVFLNDDDDSKNEDKQQKVLNEKPVSNDIKKENNARIITNILDELAEKQSLRQVPVCIAGRSRGI